MKKRIVVGASAILVVLTLAAIWQFSAQSSSDSSALSGRITELVAEVPWLKNLAQAGTLEYIIRKLAHGTIYFILGIGLTGVLIAERTRLIVVLTPLLGMMFAALDEFHQSFVPGRDPSVCDVLIDVGGVCLGMALVLFVRRGYRRWARK